MRPLEDLNILNYFALISCSENIRNIKRILIFAAVNKIEADIFEQTSYVYFLLTQ